MNGSESADTFEWLKIAVKCASEVSLANNWNKSMASK